MATAPSRVVPWLYWLLWPVHRLLLWVYFGSIHIQGKGHIPRQGPVVLAVKHCSRWDPLLIALLSQRPLRYLTNANQFGGVQGWFIERLGAFPVNLARPQAGSLRHGVDLLVQQQPLVIFPEGGIVRDRPLRSLKPGLARLVLQAEAHCLAPIAIVPVALYYHPAPRWRAAVFIRVGPPLARQPIEGTALTPAHLKHQAQQLTAALETTLEQLMTETIAQAIKPSRVGK